MKECVGLAPCSELDMVNCLVDPCRSGCEAYPNAVCESDYCNGCNAHYYVDNVEVTEKCTTVARTCSSLGCSDCMTKEGCAWCSGTVRLANSDDFVAASCIEKATAEQYCVLGTTALDLAEADSTKCVTAPPPPTEDDGVDPNEYSDVVEAVKIDRGLARFVIVITLFVSDGEIRDGASVLKVFKAGVNLIDSDGTLGEPLSSDLEELCYILKEALHQSQGINSDGIADACELVKLAATTKRQSSATHSYAATLQGSPPPSNEMTESTATATIISAITLFSAVLFALF